NNNHVAIGKESYFSARQIRGRIWAPIETTEGSQTRANNRHGWMRLCATIRQGSETLEWPCHLILSGLTLTAYVACNHHRLLNWSQARTRAAGQRGHPCRSPIPQEHSSMPVKTAKGGRAAARIARRMRHFPRRPSRWPPF